MNKTGREWRLAKNHKISHTEPHKQFFSRWISDNCKTIGTRAYMDLPRGDRWMWRTLKSKLYEDYIIWIMDHRLDGVSYVDVYMSRRLFSSHLNTNFVPKSTKWGAMTSCINLNSGNGLKE